MQLGLVVPPLVSVSAPCLGEFFVTHAASIGLFTCVGQFMFPQTGHLGKPAFASRVLASVGPLPSVGADVVLQVSGRRKGLATVLVRTYKWPLSGVHPTVDSEVLGSVEALTTPFKVTLTRTVTYVCLLDV